MRQNTRQRRRILEIIDSTCIENGDTVQIPDGLEGAFVGIDVNSGMPRGVFSRELAIEILMRDGSMKYEDAVEYYEFNVAGSYVGKQTPLWIHTKACVTTL